MRYVIKFNQQKTTINTADSVEFMYFYEFTWTNKEEEYFNNQYSITSALSSMNSYKDKSWYNEIYADELNENAAKRLLDICNLEENKKCRNLLFIFHN